MKRLAVTIALCWLAHSATSSAQIPKIAQPDSARAAALAYLEGAFAIAGRDPNYWKEEWRVDVAPSRDRTALGRPYQLGRVLAEDLAAFAETGVLAPRYGWFVYYPVVLDGHCLKLIIVKEDAGVWAAIGRKDWGGVPDSLAVAHVADGVMVAIVTINQMGGLIVVAPGNAPAYVIPLNDAVGLLAPLTRSDGRVLYEDAIRALRPRAAQLAEEFARRKNDGQ